MDFLESLTHLTTRLCSQVVSCGQVLKPEQAVPVSSTTSAWVVLNHLSAQRKQEPQNQMAKRNFMNVNLKYKSYPVKLLYLWQYISITHLYFPQCLAACGRSGRLAPSGSEKDMVLLPVVITC